MLKVCSYLQVAGGLEMETDTYKINRRYYRSTDANRKTRWYQ